MKNLLKLSVFNILITLINSCSTSKVSFEEIQNKIYSNEFSFVAMQYESNTTYSAPAGTGRIAQTNLPISPDENIGIKVSKDRLILNLPSNDKEASVNKASLKGRSEDFTVARSILDNGNILLNFFLKDNKDLNLIKMEIQKDGTIDCSVEGPKQKPLLFTGKLAM